MAIIDSGAIVFAAGAILALALSGWCIVACSSSLVSMIRSERTADRSLSPIFKCESPGLFYLQAVGLVLLIAFCLLIQVSLLIALIGRFTSS